MGSDIPNKIIVLGGAHHNGLGIVRSLGEVGNSVYFISVDSERNFVTKSKYIKKWGRIYESISNWRSGLYRIKYSR